MFYYRSSVLGTAEAYILLFRDPSLVYLVWQPPQRYNMCRQWIGGHGGPPLTESIRSSQLSTLELRPSASPATKAFDFADLPCPPSNAAQMFEPRAPYRPILAPLDWKPPVGLLNCELSAVRDPPVRAVRVTDISGPEDDGDVIARRATESTAPEG